MSASRVKKVNELKLELKKSGAKLTGTKETLVQNSYRMYESILKEMPESRSELVSQLDLPDNVSISPYSWTPHEDPSPLSEDTWATYSLSLDRFKGVDLFSDSSLPVSYSMTDSDISNGKYRRFKNRSYSYPWDAMRDASANFPPQYLESLHSFYKSLSPDLTDRTTPEAGRRRRSLEELRLKMERFLDEECRVFTPEDSTAMTLEDTGRSLDTQVDTDLDSSIRG